jgi:hypothetical protein
MIKRSFGKLKEKIDNYMDNLVDDLLILVSNEPHWKREEREEMAQTREAPTEDRENNFVTVMMVDTKTSSSQDDQTVPCDTTS